MTIHDLPAVNATLNGLSAVFLALGFVFIKRGNKTAHRNCMISAFGTSVIFLGCYLTYHDLARGGFAPRPDAVYSIPRGSARFT